MKILVVGSHGMAGHVITKYLSQQGHTVSTVARNNATYTLDIENIGLTSLFFDEIKNDFDFIINCIGLLVKDSIDNPHRASIINGWFPHFLEYTYKDTDTKIVHLSTDCVFDGKKGEYVESDTHTETNFYGKSKSLGELNNSKDVTFRMSIIGPELKQSGTGLMNWVLNSTDSELNGWSNAWWNGITTLELAKCIETHIQQPVITGVYHLVNNDVKINKYDLLCKINEIYNLGKQINKVDGPKTVNKILIDTRKVIDFKIPNYDIQLTELKNFK
jgi:dTDP-4-dehydrorhamnose reductase